MRENDKKKSAHARNDEPGIHGYVSPPPGSSFSVPAQAVSALANGTPGACSREIKTLPYLALPAAKIM